MQLLEDLLALAACGKLTFSVYGYVAATLAAVFFPCDDPTIGLLNTLLVFGVRSGPAAGRDLLRLARRPHGRQKSLIASVT